MFTLKIETGNAAFEDDLEGEVARILRKTAALLENGSSQTSVMDINGNTVGSFKLWED